jgi:hypothetical protein
MKIRSIALLMLPFALAACADKKEDVKPVRLCPQVAILRELERAKDFGSSTPDPGELVAVAAMKNVEGGCEYNETGADVRFTLNMIASRGPRLGGDRVAFPFFVSLIGPDDKIVRKELMTANFTFGSGDKRAEDHEDLHVFVPVPPDLTAEGYRVLLGFQLTEDQLKATRDAEQQGQP